MNLGFRVVQVIHEEIYCCVYFFDSLYNFEYNSGYHQKYDPNKMIDVISEEFYPVLDVLIYHEIAIINSSLKWDLAG